jgi:ectoine hydroxylase-related dioxygenase (phytanoyl-CoA dioxygenase family)
MSVLATAIERDGFHVVRGLVPGDRVEALIRAVGRAELAGNARTRGASMYGVRNLLTAIPEVVALCRSPEMRAVVEPVLGSGALAVRGIFFDKTAEANWHLGWHQDRAIAVRARHEVAGFGPWSVKAGVPHVYPPLAVLQDMLTVRVHLDAADALHGALRVLPGTHTKLLESRELLEAAAGARSVTCEVRPRDAVVMRPLLAHASGRCERPGHRRVVHIEFSGSALPGPLEWNEAIPLREASCLWMAWG